MTGVFFFPLVTLHDVTAWYHNWLFNDAESTV